MSVAPKHSPFVNAQVSQVPAIRVEDPGHSYTRECEQAFRMKFPERYAELYASPDFDARYFTLNVFGEPLYVKGLSVYHLGQKKAVWNVRTWEELPEEARANQCRSVNRMAIINRHYKGEAR